MKKLNPNDLPPHIKALNPHLLMGGLEKPKPQRDAAVVLGEAIRKPEGGEKSMVVSLVRYAHGRQLDTDNLVGGFKPLRDAIAASLGIDDGDKRIRWEYGQAETRGAEGTVVKIDVI